MGAGIAKRNHGDTEAANVVGMSLCRHVIMSLCCYGTDSSTIRRSPENVCVFCGVPLEAPKVRVRKRIIRLETCKNAASPIPFSSCHSLKRARKCFFFVSFT